MAEAEQEPLGGGSAGATAPPKKGKKTTYVILASVDGGKTWTVEGEGEATSKGNVLSHFYEDRDLPEAEDANIAPHEYVRFQAIPKSSWKALKPAPPRPRVPFAEE